MFYTFSCFFFILNILNVLSTTTTTRKPLSSLKSSEIKPLITHILVFSSDLETIISFEPKHGWMLNEEKKFRLYLSGSNLQNSSIVFSASADECTPNEFISPIYQLSSASIIELDVKLKSPAKGRSSVFLCLLPSVKSKLNDSLSQNATQLEGPYFTFTRDKSTIPFAAKICLILMLFLVSGFFR
jgi:hypothetical protein